MSLGEGALGTLGRVSGGDLRKAITTLQSAVRLKVQSFPRRSPMLEHLDPKPAR